MREGKPCNLCQKEAVKHAKQFKDRFEKLSKEGI